MLFTVINNVLTVSPVHTLLACSWFLSTVGLFLSTQMNDLISTNNVLGQ